jgi:hypothetical protein
MFVSDVELVHGPDGPISSVVSLYLSYEEPKEVGSGDVYLAILERSFKAITGGVCGKLSLLPVLGGNQSSDRLKPNMVEGALQIVDGITDDCGEVLQNVAFISACKSAFDVFASSVHVYMAVATNRFFSPSMHVSRSAMCLLARLILRRAPLQIGIYLAPISYGSAMKIELSSSTTENTAFSSALRRVSVPLPGGNPQRLFEYSPVGRLQNLAALMASQVSSTGCCCSSDDRLRALQVFEVGFGFVELGEEAFFGLELAGVDTAAAGFDADGVFEVEHLVVEEVLDRTTWRVRAVEDAADDDGVVRSVVVA